MLSVQEICYIIRYSGVLICAKTMTSQERYILQRRYSDMFINTLAWTIIFNFNIFWGVQINEYLGGLKIVWIIFGAHHKTRLVLGSSLFI